MAPRKPRDPNAPKKEVKPRPVYLVYDTELAVVNGRINKEAFVVVTRSAKEALETIDAATGRNLAYTSVLLK